MPSQFPRNAEGQWTFKYSQTGQSGEVATVLGFTCPVPTSYTQIDNNSVFTAWGVFIAAVCSTDLVLTELHTLVGDVGLVHEFSTFGAVPGANGSAQFPPNVALLLKKSTGLAGRRNRGRIYLPGIDVATADDAGVVAGASITTINAAMATFITTVSGLSHVGDVAILHREIERPVKPAYSLAAEDATVVTSITCEPILATQRGRLRD